MLRLLTSRAIQAKLRVSQPGDADEREADRNADRVVSTPEQPTVQRECNCEGGSVEAGSLPSSGEGKSLDSSIRSSMEPHFGRDFSNVRIHTDDQADRAARQIAAVAFTHESDIYFGKGYFNPTSQAGKRVLAHELTHVLQQTRGDRSTPSIQRQVAPNIPGPLDQLKREGKKFLPPDLGPYPTSKLPEPDTIEGDTTETSEAPSYRVRVVAHASPRWRGASAPKQADQLNLELSQRRAQNIAFLVERMLAAHLPAGSTVSSSASAWLDPDTLGVESEAHGSRDTLKEAHGNRRSNAQGLRRVDIYVSTNQNITKHKSVWMRRQESTASDSWHISVGVTGTGGVGPASLGLLAVQLTNDKTGESMDAMVWGQATTAEGPFPVSVAGSLGDAAQFTTRTPVFFQDFQNTLVTYDSLGINFFIGYSWSRVHLPLMRTDPAGIPASGATVGVPGVDATLLTGILRFNAAPNYPAKTRPSKDFDQTDTASPRSEGDEDMYTVYLDTGSDQLDQTEQALLDSFLLSVASARR